MRETLENQIKLMENYIDFLLTSQNEAIRNSPGDMEHCTNLSFLIDFKKRRRSFPICFVFFTYSDIQNFQNTSCKVVDTRLKLLSISSMSYHYHLFTKIEDDK